MHSLELLTQLTLGEGGLILSSPWKPIVYMLPFIPWAWIVSKVFDKHAAAYYLPRENWNLAHLTVGLVAFLGGLALPMLLNLEAGWSFWAGWGLMVLLLALDVAAFVMITNKDERVPDGRELTLDLSRFREAKASKAAARRQGTVALVLKGPDKKVVEAPLAETPEFEVRSAAEGLYQKLMAIKGSQLDLAPSAKDAYQVSFLVDGMRQAGDVMPAAAALKVIDFWKSCAKLDVSERRKKLTGDVGVEEGEARHKLRVQTSGTQAGMRATLLLDPEHAVRRKEKDLGLLGPQAAEPKALVADQKGVVLLAGVPDGGRTTTLYAIIKMHDAYTQNVQTVELEQQDTLEGARQNVWEAAADGPEFSTLVRSILRRDPDVLGIAELPDASTAKEVAKADAERTRVYVALRTESPATAINTWLKAVGDAEQASKVLRGVVVNRLVRKLCGNCKVAYQPSPDMVKKLGLPPDKVKQLYKKGGQVLIKNKPEVCPACNGVGYLGQEGLWEVYTFNDEDRSLVRKGDLSTLFKVEMRKRNVPTIQQVALRKAVDGITSVEELARLSSGGEGAAPSAPPTPASPGKAATPSA